MDKRQKSTLRKCRVKLVNDLLIDDVWDFIEGQEILTPIMLECVKAEKTRPDKVRILLDYLPRRGPNAFDKFILCLKDSGHQTLANTLLQEYSIQCGVSQPMDAGEALTFEPGRLSNQEMLEHRLTNQEGVVNEEAEPRSHSTSQETRGMDEDMEMGEVYRQEQPGEMDMAGGGGVSQSGVQESVVPPTTAHTTETASLMVTSHSSLHGYTGNMSEEYRMESDPRGLLLIINNRDFGGHMSNREGSDIDSNKLKTLFLGLGFGVDQRRNLTAQQISNNLRALAKLHSLQNVDCLAVAVLSHGSDDVIYGVDCQQIPIHEVLQPFTADNCPALHHKPKFFIFNACRGDNEDLGTLPHSINPVPGEITADVEALKSSVQCTTDRMPNLKDFLIAYSTIPRHVSLRHLKEGSWFIQGLVKVFSEMADRKDVLTMLVKVNKEVSRNVSSAGVQIPAPQVMLTKTWYLNPKPRTADNLVTLTSTH